MAVRLSTLLVIFVVSANAFADDRLPPHPDEVPPHLAGELFAHLVFPFADAPLCPDGEACLFGDGGGVGARLQWRWPRGIIVGLGYDLWLLDGNGVNEVTTTQSLVAELRYQFMRSRQVHPWLGVGVGGLILGDFFEVEAGGVLVDLSFGLEVELGASLAFTTGVLVRLFATSAFESNSDDVTRANEFGINGTAGLFAGLVLLPGD